MNTKRLATIAVGGVLAASSVMADWTDYFWITSPNSANGFAALSAGVPLALDGTGAQSTRPAFAGIWTATALGGAGQLQVAPADPTHPNYPTTAFTLTELGAAGGMTAQLTIPLPDPNVNPDFNPVGYTFDWVCNFKPGTTAWYIDADQVPKPINGGNSGTDLFFKTQGLTPGDIVGFYISGESFNALQIQGWEPVPEPTSVAMGIVTLLCATFVGYRRLRSR